jgi:hypothetical protein
LKKDPKTDEAEERTRVVTVIDCWIPGVMSDIISEEDMSSLRT